MSRALVAALLASLLGPGCGRQATPGKASAAPGAGKARGPVVARIDDEVITVDDLEQRLAGLDSYSRARFSAPEQKKRFLDNLVRFEVLAKEAQKRGYDRDPVVQQVVKNQMINQLLQRELDSKLKPEDFSAAEVESYYRAHQADFRQPEQVRVSQILVKEKATAEKVAAEARRTGTTDKGFRALVEQYSVDEDSKPQGGDLTFFDRQSTQYPKALVEAAFALKELGDVSAPVATDRDYHVLKLTQRRPGFTRPLEGMAAEIRRLILRDWRAKKKDELVAEMRQKLKVEIYEDQLAKVTVDRGAR